MKFDWPILTRCCFFLPLRRGILAFGYINILFSAFMIGLNSYAVAVDGDMRRLMYHGAVSFKSNIATEVYIALYCVEVIFHVVLVYGAHKNNVTYMKIFYYYTLASVVLVVSMFILEMATIRLKFVINLHVELLILVFAGLTFQIYLLTLVRSLIQKLQPSGPVPYAEQMNIVVLDKEKEERRSSSDDMYSSVYNPNGTASTNVVTSQPAV